MWLLWDGLLCEVLIHYIVLARISVSWEPEGHYCISKMFHWEPEGRYCCTWVYGIAPFWFSMEHFWYAITPFWLSTDDIELVSEEERWHCCLRTRKVLMKIPAGLIKTRYWDENAVQWCSIENQKGVNAIQWCSIENQKGVNAVHVMFHWEPEGH